MDRESEFWNTLYRNGGTGNESLYTPALHEKLRTLIPDNVHTILDAGCGSGTLMAFLARERKYDIQGVDRSEEGVRSVVENLKMKACVGDVLDLHQFKDDSFDLVICSEVTEHLNESGLPQCYKELFRISKNYVITTNPFKEHLSYHLIVCNRCQTRFHPAGHVNCIDESFIRHYIGHDPRVLEFHYSGRRDWRSLIYASLMQRYGHNVVMLPEQICPVCANSVTNKDRSIVARWVGRGYRLVQVGLRSIGRWEYANIIAVAEK